MQKAIEDHSQGLCLCGIPIGLLDLTEYLGFAHHHGIQAACHPKKVLHHLMVQVNVDVRLQRRTGLAIDISQVTHYLADALVKRCRGEKYFHPVAGGDEKNLLHRPEFGHLPQGRRAIYTDGSEFFTNLHRSGLVIQAYEDDAIHEFKLRTGGGKPPP